MQAIQFSQGLKISAYLFMAVIVYRLFFNYGKVPGNFNGFSTVMKYGLLALSLSMLLGSVLMLSNYQKDMQKLRDIVLGKVFTDPSQPDFVALNHWIYNNQGFAKNHGYFGLKALGPTSIDVLEQGGDCSDKSRLLMAMLDSVGIDSSLVMLYDASGKNPTHTVVDVRDHQVKTVMDPVFDISFPKPDSGFYSLGELRQSPDILIQRLDKLVQLNGADSKIAHYNRLDETYQFATTVNWDKNALLQNIATFLKKLGIEPKDVRRPHLLDDPKLFLSITFFCAGLFFMVPGLLLK